MEMSRYVYCCNAITSPRTSTLACYSAFTTQPPGWSFKTEISSHFSAQISPVFPITLRIKSKLTSASHILYDQGCLPDWPDLFLSSLTPLLSDLPSCWALKHYQFLPASGPVSLFSLRRPSFQSPCACCLPSFWPLSGATDPCDAGPVRCHPNSRSKRPAAHTVSLPSSLFRFFSSHLPQPEIIHLVAHPNKIWNTKRRTLPYTGIRPGT